MESVANNLHVSQFLIIDAVLRPGRHDEARPRTAWSRVPADRRRLRPPCPRPQPRGTSAPRRDWSATGPRDAGASSPTGRRTADAAVTSCHVTRAPTQAARRTPAASGRRPHQSPTVMTSSSAGRCWWPENNTSRHDNHLFRSQTDKQTSGGQNITHAKLRRR